jgi:hypothetical protein
VANGDVTVAVDLCGRLCTDGRRDTREADAVDRVVQAIRQGPWPLSPAEVLRLSAETRTGAGPQGWDLLTRAVAAAALSDTELVDLIFVVLRHGGRLSPHHQGMLRVLLGGNVSRYTDALRRDPQMLLGHRSYLVNAVLQGTRTAEQLQDLWDTGHVRADCVLAHPAWRTPCR